MKKLNWKEIGRFVAALMQLTTAIISAFKKAKVGPEVIEWFNGPGRSILDNKVAELASEFVKANPPALKAEVNTDLDPQLPFEGAKVEVHTKGGTVTIEKRDGELWVNGKKVILHRSTRQQNGKTLTGHELREELTSKPVVNACVLDFLLEHTEFIPESWKKGEDRNTIYIFFWGTIFRDSNGLYVRYLYWYWNGGVWDRFYGWLDYVWDVRHPSVVLTS